MKVVVNDKEFAAHRAVLAAASPFFLSLLMSDTRESKEHLIRIDLQEATASVMEDVLQYVYTGNVSVTEENAHNLMATADFLLLPGLKTVVGRYLAENLATENCISYYYFADKYQCEELKEEARDMIYSDFSAVMETEDFQNLDIKKVMEWVSSDDITVSTEEEVFKGIVKWVSRNKSEREVDFPSLLHQVRLVSIPHDFLLNELVKEELVAKNSVLCLNFVLDAIRLIASATAGQVIQKPRKCLETHMDAIFVCGGKRALCYFPKQNLWYQLSSMAYDHDCSNTPFHCQNKIYIPCSRSNDCQGAHLMEFYIPNTNSYSSVQLETNFNSTTVLKGYLYATCDELNRKRGIYRYDPEKNYLEKLKAQPTPRQQACFLSDEQYLYTIGGTSRGQCLSTAERFDPSANKWEEVAPINQARSAAFGASMNGKVYIAGGQWKKDTISSCEVYNPVTNEWHLMASLKEPRRCASMVPYKGSLYVLGGLVMYVYHPQAHNRWSVSRGLSVEIFHSEQNEWETKTAIPLNCIETSEELDKERFKFKACFARLHKGVIDKLKPLNTQQACYGSVRF